MQLALLWENRAIATDLTPGQFVAAAEQQQRTKTHWKKRQTENRYSFESHCMGCNCFTDCSRKVAAIFRTENRNVFRLVLNGVFILTERLFM